MHEGVMRDADKWQAEEALNKQDSAADLNTEWRALNTIECKAKLKAQLKLLPRYILPVTCTARSLRLRCLIHKLCCLILPHWLCLADVCRGWLALNLRV